MTLNYKMQIQYDGTKFQGWQKLPGNDSTIQGKLEAILSRLFNESIDVIGSGRTDKGVHALMQTANFHVSGNAVSLTDDEILGYINNYLPEDIAVISLERAQERFHARFNCVSKTYRYSIDNGKVRDVFQNRFRYYIPGKLDIEAMRQASRHLIGKMDFRSFTTLKSKTKSTVREIFSIEFKTPSEGLIDIYFKGDGFLYNMVRIITGTLIEAGLGRISPEDIPAILEASDRSRAGYTAPPQGLCLYEVNY